MQLQVDGRPEPIRWELFNTTLWAADSITAAQPLIATALVNARTKPPLHDFGKALSAQQSMRGLESEHSASADEEPVQHEGREWDAPKWLVPLAACLSVGAPCSHTCSHIALFVTSDGPFV